MRERRFLVPEIATGQEVEIRGAEAHHLLHVLRLRPGERVVLFDGKGHQFQAVLTRCRRSTATAGSLEPLPSRESPLELALAVAIPKGEAMDRIVQKATELGVKRIIPLLTARNVASRRVAGGKLSRWRRIAAEACKLSGRSRIPEVADPLDFEELLGLSLPPRKLLLTAGGDPLSQEPPPEACLAAVGPEGGWSEAERYRALGSGFRLLGLGPRTLRTETAAMAAAALLQWAWGDAGREDGRR